MKALDISNYTTGFDDAAAARLQGDGYGLVIFQAFPYLSAHYAQQIAQMQTCQRVGLPMVAYIYDYLATPQWRDSALEGLSHAWDQGLQVVGVAADEEDTTLGNWSVDSVTRAIQTTLDALSEWLASHGLTVPALFYTGNWWLDAHLPGVTQFARYPLWLAQYDADPNLASVHLEHGWASVAIKQYAGSTSADGVGGVDLDVADDTLLAQLRPAPQEEDVQIPQEYQDKFSIGPTDVQGLIDHFEGVIAMAREIAYAQGSADGSDATAKLEQIRQLVGAPAQAG